jgi:hypothetical protein
MDDAPRDAVEGGVESANACSNDYSNSRVVADCHHQTGHDSCYEWGEDNEENSPAINPHRVRLPDEMRRTALLT